MDFRRWVIWSFLAQFAIVVLDRGGGFVLSIILQHYPVEKGNADLVSSLPFVLTAVANLGLATSLVYLVRKKRYSVEAAAETTSLVALVWGGLVALAAIAVFEFLLPALNPTWEVSPWLYVPLCLCTPLRLLASYLNSLQLATDRFRDYNLVQLLESLATLPLWLVCFYGFAMSAPRATSVGRFLQSVLLLVAVLWMVRDFVRLRPRLHGDFLREGLSLGWKANTVSVLTYLNHRLDIFCIKGLYVGQLLWTTKQRADAASVQVTYYSIAMSFAAIVWQVPEATRDLFFSKVASSSHEEARKTTPILARLCFSIAILGGVGISLLIDPLIRMIGWVLPWLYPAWYSGENYSLYVMPTLWLLVPGTATFALAKILQNDLAGRGRLGLCVLASVLNLGLMIGLDVLWIPAEGALGAARASSIAFLVSSAYTLWIYQKNGGAPWHECVIPRPSDWQYVREIAVGLLCKLRLRRASA